MAWLREGLGVQARKGLGVWGLPPQLASGPLLSLLGALSATVLYALLPLALLLVLAVPVSALLALWIHRKSREAPPEPPEPVSNNSLPPEAVHLIRNATHGNAEPGLREEGVAAKAGLPKTDISNEERAKLNRLNTSPDLQRPSL